MKGLVGNLEPLFDDDATRMQVAYQLTLGDQVVPLSEYLGAGVTLTYLGDPHCVHCEEPASRLMRGGYCHRCYYSLARCDLCVMSPERCHYHLGTCREPRWGEEFCMQPHVVYVAITSSSKIGITRSNRSRRRWLDQGASQAMIIADAPTRRAAGVVEAYLKRWTNDRTDWRMLVSGRSRHADLVALADQLRRSMPSFDVLPSDVLGVDECARLSWRNKGQLVEIEYPVNAYSPPQRLRLSKRRPRVCDNLLGIVGQYLLFSRGVINLGDYSGTSLEMEIGSSFVQQDLADSNQLSLFD